MSRQADPVVVTATGLAVGGLRDAADLFDPPDLPPLPGGFAPEVALRRRGWKYRDRPTRLASCAAEPALGAAGLPADGAGARAAVIVSSNFDALDTTCQAMDVIAERGSAGLSPMSLPHTGANMVAGWLAIDHGLHGPNLTLSNGGSSGLDALHFGRNLILAGRADLVLVVGVEPDNEVVARLTGDGTRFEGAAAVVLESTASAAARGVRALAAVGGYARATGLREAAARAAGPGGQADLLLYDAADEEARPSGPAVLDLSARLGRASGALGVLQCLAAVAAFGRSGANRAVAACGGAEEGAAALALTRMEALR